MSKRDVIVLDKMYIPIELVYIKAAKEKFTHQMYEDAVCQKCQFFQERPHFSCDGCAANLGEIRTYKEHSYQGQKYIGLPLGQKKEFLNYLRVDDYDELNIIDKRHAPKFDYPITFGGRLEGELRVHQVPIAEMFLKHKYGIIEAPPRFGKTLLSVYIGVELGYKMLVLASQNEFLNQFIEHVADFTNLPKLEKKHGKKLFGVAKKPEDFENFQIAASTYQRFLSEKGQKLLKFVAKQYGTVWVDECFTYGHRVKTEKGLVTIGDIVTKKVKVEKVLSFNHQIEKEEYKNIESFTKKTTKKLCRVKINGEYIICTPNHEFYVKGKGYVKALDLKVGDDVLDLNKTSLTHDD